MQWIEVSVPTRSDEIDDVCAQLAELGAGGMVVEDETDFQQFLEMIWLIFTRQILMMFVLRVCPMA